MTPTGKCGSHPLRQIEAIADLLIVKIQRINDHKVPAPLDASAMQRLNLRLGEMHGDKKQRDCETQSICC